MSLPPHIRAQLGRQAVTRQQIERLLVVGEAHRVPEIAIKHAVWHQVPQILDKLWRAAALDETALGPAIAVAWTVGEHPLRCVPEARWLLMFEQAGFLTYPLPPGQATPLRPTGDIVVWRAASGVGRGMSWTPQRRWAAEIAQQRANQQARQVGLYRARIETATLLGLLGQWPRQEAIIDPRHLRGRVRKIESFNPDYRTARYNNRLVREFGLPIDVIRRLSRPDPPPPLFP